MGALPFRWTSIGTGLWGLIGQTWVRVLALTFPSCVIFGKWLTLSEPQFCPLLVII